MQEHDAPPAHQEQAPADPTDHQQQPISRCWIRDRPSPEVTTGHLVQWIDENGSVVRLISTDSATTSRGNRPFDR